MLQQQANPSAHLPVPAAAPSAAPRRRTADPVRRWRVIDKGTGRGYRIIPGPVDGTADAFGVADLWVLHYRASELDDGVGVVGGDPADTRCRLDKYLTGESVDGTDIVVWYAGHFTHDEEHPPHQGHIVGPELRPISW